jgi:hypothetical protein
MSLHPHQDQERETFSTLLWSSDDGDSDSDKDCDDSVGDGDITHHECFMPKMFQTLQIDSLFKLSQYPYAE